MNFGGIVSLVVIRILGEVDAVYVSPAEGLLATTPLCLYYPLCLSPNGPFLFPKSPHLTFISEFLKTWLQHMREKA